MKFTVTKYLGFLENENTILLDINDINEIKVEFMKIINTVLEKKSLTQVQSAQILGIDQPKVSYIKNLHVAGFSLSRLLGFLLKLNYEIELVINISDDIAIIKVDSNINDTKLEVMYLIISIIAKCNLSQEKAASLMGIYQSKVSHINRLKTDRITLEFLLNLLGKMDYHIEFVVKGPTIEE